METGETKEEAPATDAPTGPALPSDALVIVPVRDTVLFPGLVLPVTIGRPGSIAAAQQAVRDRQQVGILMQRDAEVSEPAPGDMHTVGTVANIVRYVTAPDGTQAPGCQGIQSKANTHEHSSHHTAGDIDDRFTLPPRPSTFFPPHPLNSRLSSGCQSFLSGWPFLVARVVRETESAARTPEIEARFLNLRTQAIEAIELLPQAAQRELTGSARAKTRSSRRLTLCDFATRLHDVTLPAGLRKADRALETVDIAARIEKTRTALDERQREALLREQMAAIQRQLGEGEEGRAAEMADLGQAITDAKMPKEVEEQARKELRRLQRMPESAGEFGMVHTYLDWLTELPWSLPEESPIDITEARRILDEDHYDLDKIKRRIVEYLASIARAMNRKFVRVSLGGVHDEAEIRGHLLAPTSRTLPGKQHQLTCCASSRKTPVLAQLLTDARRDSTSSVGAGYSGDPARCAILDGLVSEQNHTFRDNYLGVPFDLSRVVFLTTANMLENTPGPLRDRMEVISLPGYTADEKLQIARRYLVRRQMEANGLMPDQVDITDEAISEIIQQYTREAGVRNLEREIGRTLRHTAVRIAEGDAGPVSVSREALGTILGPPQFESEVAMRTSVPGVATGLAWTPVGGDILFIEATRVPGHGKLILTGQLGDVMKESAQAALSLVKNQAAQLGIHEDRFETGDIHVHVPAGATPKDGPSAGVAMYMALASLMTDRTVRSDTAMTGEISLRGLVLPVGGIKEKVIAAHRAGIQRVMLPARNRKDFEDIPEGARMQLEFVWLDRVEQAVESSLESAPAPASAVGATKADA
ncbi:Lon protease [Geodia barretti]|uniref:Lon protease homolog n=1 Tax=Geodia barretti TaxID=519541 RepID=A0AA35S8B0_GEOBA|nr:Lon protease [Geodia barretti]